MSDLMKKSVGMYVDDDEMYVLSQWFPVGTALLG